MAVKFLNKSQILELLPGITKSCLAKWIKDGHFPPPQILSSKTMGNRTIKAWREDVVEDWARNLPTATPETAPIVAAGNAYRRTAEYEERRRNGLLKQKKKRDGTPRKRSEAGEPSPRPHQAGAELLGVKSSGGQNKTQG